MGFYELNHFKRNSSMNRIVYMRILAFRANRQWPS